MPDIAIMIEGQNGLNWTRWQRLSLRVEELGFAGLYRSDHYTNMNPPDKDSLEMWISLAWLASHTKKIKFGPLVSPVSFRHPTLTARMAAAVDDLSGGRLQLGMGAGWQEREHNNYGWDLLNVPDRMKRLEEGLQVVKALFSSEQPINFQGQYYCLQDAILLPRPKRNGGPPITVGGNGPKRTIPLTARYADEWNAVFISPERFEELNRSLDENILEEGRNPAELRRSIMVGTIFGRDEGELRAKIDRFSSRQGVEVTVEDLRQHGWIAGTPSSIGRQIERYAEAGAQGIMLQWLDLDDLDGLDALGQALL